MEPGTTPHCLAAAGMEGVFHVRLVLTATMGVVVFCGYASTTAKWGFYHSFEPESP